MCLDDANCYKNYPNCPSYGVTISGKKINTTCIFDTKDIVMFIAAFTME